MIAVHSYAGRTVAVFGLGRSGLSVVDALVAGRANVVAWDDSEAPRIAAKARNVDLRDLRSVNFESLDALVLSPGVPLTHPEPHWTVHKAHDAGIAIIGDTELLVRELAGKARLVAITGTNGKSTTTALIAHVLDRVGLDVRVGGNIGTPVLSLEEPGDNSFYVVEFSSYQIDLTPSLKPDIAVHLNISPDHLDRHGSLENYAAVKERIFALQGAGDTAVVGVDDGLSREISGRIPAAAAKIEVSAEARLPDGVFAEDRQILAANGGSAHVLADLNGITTLRGRHNGQNAAAAAAAALAAGVGKEALQDAFNSFPGLAHRLEQVGRIGPVLFINDSKATNSDAAACALSCFERIYWIAGGLAKYGGIENLKEFLPKIAKAYLIGEAAEAFGETIGKDAAWEVSGTLAQAVASAARDSAHEDGEAAVLLSPACASFDQFANFEIRGEAFRQAVLQVPGIATD